MKKSIKIALGVGVVVVGYFLYKKNKGIEPKDLTGMTGSIPSTQSTESTESTESTANKNVVSGISTDGSARFYGSDDQTINDSKVDFKKLGIKVGDKIYATKKGNVGMKITSIYNKNVLTFRNASTYPLFKEPTEYTIRKQQ
tara:strand:- start:525 stop:950 length:426 start_codon:yes stop_codon:yes gene_type:complete